MGGRGGGGDVLSNANAGVPALSRKVVQSLKEIVNCPDFEIYTMLVECDMDPNEAASRLLSQDTFQEVKSKREKKKKTKNSADSWTRNIPSRRAKSGNDNYNTYRGGVKKYNSNETGTVQGILANGRKNGARNQSTGFSLASGVLGRQPPSNSDPPTSEVKKTPTVLTDAVTNPAYQSAWASANPGQRTMADIVKMGRPYQQKNIVLLRSSEAQESESKAPVKDDLHSVENQDVSYPSWSAEKPSADSKMFADQFSEPQHLNETHNKTNTSPIGSPPPTDADQFLSPSVSSKNLHDVDSTAKDVSASVATGFQQLNIDNKEEQEALPKEDKPTECSHLMFGSFGSAIETGQASDLNNNLDKNLEAEDDASFRHPDNNYYEEEEQEQLKKAVTDEQASYQVDPSAQSYHSVVDSETEALQHNPPEEEGRHQYKFSTDYGFDNSQQLNNPPSETNIQMQNLDTFPNIMNVWQQGYTSSLPNTLLPSGVHYLPFPTNYDTVTPSSLHGPAISMAEALRAASISPQNASPNANQQATVLAQHVALNPYSHQPGMPLEHYGYLISYPYMPQSYNPYMASPAFQPAFPPTGNHQQSLAAMLPPYRTQATTPFVPSASVYGFGDGASSSNNNFPLNHTPVPSAASVYGFGDGASSSNNNFPLNHTSATNSYENVLNTQFRDSNHLASSLQQQNENSPAWHQGQQPNSGVIPESGYYSFTGHNQQPPSFCQAQQLQQQQQQPSQQQQQSHQQQQHFGGLGYVNPYHSQVAMSLEHLHHQHQQKQNARDASKQIQQQLWPPKY